MRTGRHRLQSAQAMIRRYPARTAAALVTAAMAVAGGVAIPAMAANTPPPASASAKQAWAEPLVAGTPCSVSARACVDLYSQQAWLIHDGKVTRGPMKIASGGNGKPTPIAHSDRVYRKDKDHKSLESRLPNGQPAPMPYSTFFADGGIAFHSGSPNRASAGCIHMEPADAIATFNDLQLGDKVQVVDARQELAARHMPPPPPLKPAPKPVPPPKKK